MANFKIIFCIFLLISFANTAKNPLDTLPYDENLESKSIELLISYKLIAKNGLAHAERYRVSHALHYRGQNVPVLKECAIDASAYPIMDDMPFFITSIIKQEKEQVLECLLAFEAKVTESTLGRNGALRSKATLELAPWRVRAKLEDKSIIISILQKEGAK